MSYPELCDGDQRIDHTWGNEDLAEPAEALADWLDQQAGKAFSRMDTDRHVFYRDAADLVRELADRLPPFPLTYRTPRIGPDAGKTTVEIAGHTITGNAFGDVFKDQCMSVDLLARHILEACERAHGEAP